MKTKIMNKSISLFLVLATMVSCCAVFFTVPVLATSVSFPSISQSNYIETKAEVSMPVYQNEKMTVRGTCSPSKRYNAVIDQWDTVRIITICSNNAVLIEYPTSSGWRRGYCAFSNFFNYKPSKTFTATTGATVYAAPYGSSYGKIVKGDTVYRVGESNGHVLVIYQAKSGNRGYKLGYTSNTSYEKIKKQDPVIRPVSSTSSVGYNGIDYTKLTSDKDRIASLDKAKAMVTVCWTAPCDFVTWCSSKGEYNKVIATDGTESTKYIKGKTYIGVPYSMNNHSYDEKKWLTALPNITSKSMKANYYSHGKEGTALGVDCSYFVYTCFKNTSVANNLKYQTTKSMLNSNDYTKLKNYNELQPADLLLKNGHVMLFVGKTSDGKYAVFEATAEGSKCRYHEFSYSEITQYKPYRFNGFDN